jgi:lipopolysaccharide export system protein LptA
MNQVLFRIITFICLLVLGVQVTHAQEPVGQARDTSRRINILSNTKRLTIQTIDDSTKLTIVVGNVKLRQGTALIYCDSCILNSRTNVFEAWGRQVHINDADTIDIYSNHLIYQGDKRLANLDGNVKLTDGKGVLTTPDLEYNMETNIGIYTHGGKVVNGKTVLTSKEGWYFADFKDVWFKKNVVLKDPAYDIVTDSLLYNTVTKQTRFVSYTTITDTTGRIIRTSEGFYNQQTGMAEFGQRPVITDKKSRTRITGDRISQTDSLYVINGNGVIIDTVKGTTLIGGIIMQNKKTEAVLATRKPLMIIKQNDDSIYVTADTLFTARITDRFPRDSVVTDSVTGKKMPVINEKDSTNRYFEAYSHVRIFNDSLQAVGDSCFYSFQDSVFRLFKDPVVWAQDNQVTGDTILLFTKNKKADRVEAFENGFMINRLDAQAFNQVKSVRIDGWFLNGEIDSVRAKGYAECIYYIQDNDSAYTGVNESKADLIDIYFVSKALDRVVFRSAVTGTLWPIRQKSPSEMKLPGFRWLDERRPKTKYEMFE